MEILKFECQYCKKIFERTKRQASNRRNKFCSVACERANRKKGKIIKCGSCGKELYVSASRLLYSPNFCSMSCSTIYKHIHGKFKRNSALKFNLVDWKLCQELHNNGVPLRHLRKYGATQKYIDRAVKLGLFKKTNRRYKHTDETKLKLSQKRKEYLKNNPDKNPYGSHPQVSIPCELVKKYLFDNEIKFIPEFPPLDSRFFHIDIAFPDKMIGVEINGNQHYDKQRNLLTQYQERHDLIVKSGWILLEIPYVQAYNTNFLNDLKKFIETKEPINFFVYEKYKPKEKKKLKYGNRQNYTKSVRSNWESSQQKYIQIVLSSDIDFSKFGWVEKVAKLINRKSQKIKKWMIRMMPEFYEKNCFKRKPKINNLTIS